jgi:type III secretory pathway component EscU
MDLPKNPGHVVIGINYDEDEPNKPVTVYTFHTEGFNRIRTDYTKVQSEDALSMVQKLAEVGREMGATNVSFSSTVDFFPIHLEEWSEAHG